VKPRPVSANRPFGNQRKRKGIPMYIRMMTMMAMLAGHGLAAEPYSSLEELMTDMSRKQVEAIRAYLDENPEAEDAEEAREGLIYGLIALDDYGGALDLLERMYEALPDDKSGLEVSMAFGEVVVPIIQLYRMDGRMEEALAFIARVRDDFKDHTAAATIREALDEFASMFDLPKVGDVLDIAFIVLDGREIDLSAMKGSVVLVDFWASWCMPCIRAMPGLKELHATYHDQGFEIIGISLDEERDKLERYLQKEAIPWPQYFDGNGWENEFAARYGIQSIPATFLIGPEGVIVAVDPGADELAALVASLLGGEEQD